MNIHARKDHKRIDQLRSHITGDRFDYECVLLRDELMECDETKVFIREIYLYDKYEQKPLHAIPYNIELNRSSNILLCRRLDKNCDMKHSVITSSRNECDLLRYSDILEQMRTSIFRKSRGFFKQWI